MTPALAAGAGLAAAAAAPWQAAVIRAELPAGARTPPAAVLAAAAGAAGGALGLLLPAALMPAVLVYLVLAVPAAVIDAHSRRLPDRLTRPGYPLLAAALAAGSLPTGHPGRLLGAAAGCAAALAFFAVQALAAPTTGPGLGDLKLAGLNGALLGWAGLLPWVTGLLAGYLLHLAAAVLAAAAGRTPLRGHHPFGPALVAGTLLTLAALRPLTGAGQPCESRLSRFRGLSGFSFPDAAPTAGSGRGPGAPPRRRARLPAALAAATLAAGCAAHPAATTPPDPAGRIVPRPAISTAQPGGAALHEEPAADPRPAGPAAAAAVGTARAFLRAALGGPTAAGWLPRTRRYTTTALRRSAPPAPPAAGAVRVLSAQLAADTPSTGRTAHVEAAAVVTPTGGGRVPVTAYLTLTRTPAGWLVDAVRGWA